MASRRLAMGWIVSALMALGFVCQAQDAARKIRILGVGNSFTQNSIRYLPSIIGADPAVQADIGGAIIGGCSLERHCMVAKLHEANPDDPKGKAYRYMLNGKTAKSGASLKEILLDGPWDYITIQQVSTGSYRQETFYPYARELYDYIKQYAPKATIVIHETWAHRVDCPRVKQWHLPPAAMYEKVHANYTKVAGELGVKIIPVGTAFENAKKLPMWDYAPPAGFDPKALTYPDLPDQSKSLHSGYSWRTDKKDKTKKSLRMDGYHAGRPGEFLGGMVWYEFFFGRDARANTYCPKELTEEQAKSLRGVAHETVEAVR